MPLSYDLDNHLKDLEAVLDDYTEWYLQVTRRLFYPTEAHEAPGGVFVCPPTFGTWLKGVQKTASIKPSLLHSLNNLHRDLCTLAEELLRESEKTKLSPQYKSYHKLAVMFEEFTGHIRRVEKDCLMEDSGIDAITGLRSKDAMEKDIKREMDRLARQGKSFALALVQIDNYDVLKTQMKPDESEACLKTVAEMVKKCMRSFDDAYHMDGMFVLSLKQTGTSGGIRALKRLKADLDKSKATYTVQGKAYPISLSSCIGEPNETENVVAFIENLKKDLNLYQTEQGGTVVKYTELSPLQRFIREQDKSRG